MRPVRVLIDPSGLGAFPGLCQLVKERIPCLSCNAATMPPRPGGFIGVEGHGWEPHFADLCGCEILDHLEKAS